MTDDAVNSLAQNVGVFGGLLRPSDFNPGAILTGSGNGSIVQNNNGIGSFSTQFQFNTSALNGSFFNINITPVGSTLLTGGSAAFNVASQDSFIAGSNLPIIGFPAAANASITAFQVQNISSEGSSATPHVVMGIQFVDTISNVSGTGGARFQVSP